jgi:hypothetical protein
MFREELVLRQIEGIVDHEFSSRAKSAMKSTDVVKSKKGKDRVYSRPAKPEKKVCFVVSHAWPNFTQLGETEGEARAKAAAKAAAQAAVEAAAAAEAAKTAALIEAAYYGYPRVTQVWPDSVSRGWQTPVSQGWRTSSSRG